MLKVQRGECAGLANESPWQQRLDDLVLELVALLLEHLAHLVGFDLLDLLGQFVAHYAAGQQALLLSGGDEQEAAAGVHQRCVRALAERSGEAVGGQFLAFAGACRLAGQGLLQRRGVDLQVLGEAVDLQVAEPHGVSPGWPGAYTRRQSRR